MKRTLSVYFGQHYAGQLVQQDNAILSFTYSQQYIDNRGIPLSCVLPIQAVPFRGKAVQAFFSGLLPDETARSRLARYLGLSERNAFALLSEVGGECAGAITILPHGQPLPHIAGSEVHHEPLSESALKQVFSLLKRQPLLVGEDGLRLSLAGAQDKLPVTLMDEDVVLPHAMQPTTHILKPPIETVDGSVFNEFFCMRLAGMLGVDVPNVSLKFAEDLPYLCVERYDRGVYSNGDVFRLHQEDFCQALGQLPEFKYEREGGPSIQSCITVLRGHSMRYGYDVVQFLQRVMVNFIIGNADAHGKNFSLLYQDLEKPRLASAYDVLSTAIYPEMTERMAMKIGGRYQPKHVLLRHWERLVPDTHTAKRQLYNSLQTLAKKSVPAAKALQDTLAKQGITSPVFDEIIAVIEQRSNQIERYG